MDEQELLKENRLLKKKIQKLEGIVKEQEERIILLNMQVRTQNPAQKVAIASPFVKKKIISSNNSLNSFSNSSKKSTTSAESKGFSNRSVPVSSITSKTTTNFPVRKPDSSSYSTTFVKKFEKTHHQNASSSSSSSSSANAQKEREDSVDLFPVSVEDSLSQETIQRLLLEDMYINFVPPELQVPDDFSPIRSSVGMDYEELVKLKDVEVPCPAEIVQNLKHNFSVSLEGEDATSNTCSICLENFSESGNNKMIAPPCCLGKFHANCLEKWLETSATCPNCRTDLREILD